MTNSEAANILGITIQEVKRLQDSGHLPSPVPDDYLDAVANFRIQIEQANRRRLDRFSRGETPHEGNQ